MAAVLDQICLMMPICKGLRPIFSRQRKRKKRPCNCSCLLIKRKVYCMLLRSLSLSAALFTPLIFGLPGSANTPQKHAELHPDPANQCITQAIAPQATVLTVSKFNAQGTKRMQETRSIVDVSRQSNSEEAQLNPDLNAQCGSCVFNNKFQGKLIWGTCIPCDY